MAWLQSLDAGLLRFIHLHWQHPVLDVVMKFLSGNAVFYPALVIIAVLLIWKGGVRGRVFVAVLAAILAAGDSLVIAMLKETIGRARPFMAMPDLNLIVGKGSALRSMPSGHASIWFAATLVTFVYYRRSWRFMLPLACGVSLSRVYLGVHYPSDVLAGAIMGAGYAAAGLILLNTVWRLAGRAWFPVWWEEFPSLLYPAPVTNTGEVQRPEPTLRASRIDAASHSAAPDQHWLRLGYVVIAVTLLTRLVYLASGTIDLSKDEAYQWLWSKHLALSYYSKPPLIAYTQWLGTSIWGDTAFGVRFFSPVIGAAVALLVLRFMARLAGGRMACIMVLVFLATPLLAVGSTLLTIDPLLVLFWTLAMILGWRAVQPDSMMRHWLGVGLAMGLAFLSKYSALYQVVCFGIFFALWPPARLQLRRPGPYLALLVTLLCTLPVVVWNAQHAWITLTHVSERSGLQAAWQPTLRFFWEFIGAETGLLNPVFLIAALWAMVAFWKHERVADAQSASRFPDGRRAVMIYLFSMGWPVFLGHWLYSLYTRVLPNWIAPAVVPMFCLMVLYWEQRWREGVRIVQRWLTAGLVVGFVVLVVLQEPRAVEKLVGRALPADKDPLRRVRAWPAAAQVVDEARKQLLAEGKPAFIITGHYGFAGELSFYLPEAKKAVRTTPMVYYLSSERPKNQLYFWPHYRYRNFRKGQNAIYVSELDAPRTSTWAWLSSIFTGETLPAPTPPPPESPPPGLLDEFASVKNLGVKPVLRRRQVYYWVQLFECRDLR